MTRHKRGSLAQEESRNAQLHTRLSWRHAGADPAGAAVAHGALAGWVDELGAAAVNPGTPLGKSWLVRAEGVSPDVPDPLTGFSIVAADDLEAALAIARRCPYAELAAIEVAEARSL